MPSESINYNELLLQEIQSTPQEFHPKLLQLIHSFRENLVLYSAEESFKRGWEEAMEEETFPISSLWEEIHAE